MSFAVGGGVHQRAAYCSPGGGSVKMGEEARSKLVDQWSPSQRLVPVGGQLSMAERRDLQGQGNN